MALSISFKHHVQGGCTWSSLFDRSAIPDGGKKHFLKRSKPTAGRFWLKVFVLSQSRVVYETHVFGNKI